MPRPPIPPPMAPSPIPPPMAPSPAPIGVIPHRMNQAWNRGDAAAFAADFAVDARFVAFDGTVLSGREAIVEFHRPLFETTLKGSRLVGGGLVFAQTFSPGWGFVHHRVEVVLPGQDSPSPSRESMQLLVVRWCETRWEVVALQNSRVVTVPRQLLLDGLEAGVGG